MCDWHESSFLNLQYSNYLILYLSFGCVGFSCEQSWLAMAKTKVKLYFHLVAVCDRKISDFRDWHFGYSLYINKAAAWQGIT